MALLEGALSTEDIQAILAAIGLTPQSVRRPGSGLTSSVFILETAQGDFILKVSRDPASDWKLGKERIVYGLLRRQGLPAPQVLVTDLSHYLVSFAYTLSERLPGVTLSHANADMSAAERVGVYRQLGDMMGWMHSLTFDCFGDVMEQDGITTVGPAQELAGEAAGANTGPFATWHEMHKQIVRGRLSFLSHTEFHDLVEPVAYWFGDHEDLLDYPISPRLLHMDLHMSNILVSGGMVSGILDVEEAVIGHNEYDLMRTELAHFGDGYEALREAFFEAYTALVLLDDGYEGRKPLYELSRSLVGLKCLVLYGSRAAPKLAEETQRVRARICALIEKPLATSPPQKRGRRRGGPSSS